MTVLTGIVLLLLGAGSSAAGAHPLGNYTINRYARVEVSAGVVRVYYVQDSAEIPAFQVRRQVDADRAGYLRREVALIRSHLTLTVGGRTLPLRAAKTGLDRPKGEAGLLTLRIAAIYEARLPAGSPSSASTLTFADRNQPGHLGWREIVVVARGDAHLRSSTAPDRDLSDELRHYPNNLIQAPLDLRSVRATFVPGSTRVDAAPLPRAGTPPKRSGDSLTDLVTRQNLDLGVVIGMLGVAFAIGAGHAFLPGHGKTLMGAYLVGTKGRAIDAFLLGAIVSLMHTASVLALGLILFRVNKSISLERIYPTLTVLSGLLAAAFGVFLLITRYRRIQQARRDHVAGHDHAHAADLDLVEDPEHPAVFGTGAPLLALVGVPTDTADHAHEHPHDHARSATDHHGHDHHDHDHDHGHGHAHDDGEAAAKRRGQFGHSHGPGQWHTHELPPDVPPFSRRGIVMLATSGGLIPSPSAVLVLVSAFSLGRATLGLSLIGAFSLGLAGTLTAIGLSLVFGRGFVERHWGRSLEVLPVIGAGAMILLGLALAARGFLS